MILVIEASNQSVSSICIVQKRPYYFDIDLFWIMKISTTWVVIILALILKRIFLLLSTWTTLVHHSGVYYYYYCC